MNPSIPPTLEQLRERIDALDRQLVDLLNARAAVAQMVGEVKAQQGAPVYRPEREAQVITRVQQSNQGPLPGEALAAIYREVMSACRALERRLRVAFLGPAGTFSEQALIKHFGSSVDAVPMPSIDEVFRATETGLCDFGIVPVENSTEGVVNRSLDLMLGTQLTICGEVSVPVRHTCMSRSGSLEGVQRICAHPQALAQCQRWLDTHAKGIERSPVASNAEGARLAGEDPSVAAIASVLAVSRYGVQIVAENIQDEADNRTRFLALGHYRTAASGHDQTSLILSVPDRAGAVHALIEPLARHGVSMKRFESRPARQGTWEYYFYIDVLGHQDDAAVAAALLELKDQAAFYRVLGSYPRAS
jgi:chorismate mutase/prephenate dehydratase